MAEFLDVVMETRTGNGQYDVVTTYEGDDHGDPYMTGLVDGDEPSEWFYVFWRTEEDAREGHAALVKALEKAR